MKLKSLHFVNGTAARRYNVIPLPWNWCWDALFRGAHVIRASSISLMERDYVCVAIIVQVRSVHVWRDMIFGFGYLRNKVATAAAGAKKIRKSGLMRCAINAILKIAFSICSFVLCSKNEHHLTSSHWREVARNSQFLLWLLPRSHIGSCGMKSFYFLHLVSTRYKCNLAFFLVPQQMTVISHDDSCGGRIRCTYLPFYECWIAFLISWILNDENLSLICTFFFLFLRIPVDGRSW